MITNHTIKKDNSNFCIFTLIQEQNMFGGSEK